MNTFIFFHLFFSLTLNDFSQQVNILTELPNKERVKSLEYFYTENIIPSLEKVPCIRMKDEELICFDLSMYIA